MCGISAVAGYENVTPQLISSLKKLEYRGYDSCGIFVFDGTQGFIKKNIGETRRTLEQSAAISVLRTPVGQRTAGVTQKNAHPFYSNDKNFTLVHNGIIDNFRDLKEILLKEGYQFESETDSEVFVNLVQKLYAEEQDTERAFIRAVKLIKGHYAFALFSRHEPTKIFAVKKDSPLILGPGNGVNFIASDINAFLEWTRDAVIINDDEYIVASNNTYSVRSVLTGEIITPRIISVNWDSQEAQKGGFEHFMLKEIFEQPQTVRHAMSVSADDIAKVGKLIAESSQNSFLGVGTTYYVALYGSYLFAKNNELEKQERMLYDFAGVISEIINTQSGTILKLAEKYISDSPQRRHISNWLYLGKGIYHAIALEAALKMKEITYLHAEGMSAGFLKHGTLSLVDQQMATFFFMPDESDDALYRSTLHALQEVKARNGIVVCFGNPENEKLIAVADDIIPLPKVEAALYPYYELIIAQLFAYYSATRLKRNVDKPRNLAKSVTVA
ncbi:hypothetical protein CHS0354_035368 [Potamilus streckersoni]|uniref:glutamine--fructose-6-phosphate transaminase (isomerizing) n=1 Tax=Potamilus streckersoni TaxID=2493646 RepID=A0AAE0S2M9_9BIVA|nr:hypothetical protein CHS0354_035368 [Potamilus streckersoni]